MHFIKMLRCKLNLQNIKQVLDNQEQSEMDLFIPKNFHVYVHVLPYSYPKLNILMKMVKILNDFNSDM